MAAFEASAYADRGIAKSGKGDWDGAIEDFTKIYELRPRWSEAALRSPQSLEISRVAAKVTPDFAIAYNNRGIVKGAKGDLDGAIKDFNEAIRLRPDLAQLYNNRGISEEAKGDKDGANADFAKATQLRPKPAPTEGSPPPIRAYGVVGPTSAVPTDSAHFREYGKQDLRERCIPFADGSVDKVLAKTMPLPPKECREVLGWMRDSRLTTLYDGQPKQ
jgi:tetratricopeptide (TPR) repeat protein